MCINTGTTNNTWDIITKVIALVAFLISLWNLFSPYLLRLKLHVIFESQIQLMEDVSKRVLGFNILATIVSTGPGVKWETFRFNDAELIFPNGDKYIFTCRSYLDEKGMGQANASRNIPIAIKGSESKTITSAYQYNSIDTHQWIVGTYKLKFNITNSHNSKISAGTIEFHLTQEYITILKKPDAIFMCPCTASSSL